MQAIVSMLNNWRTHADRRGFLWGGVFLSLLVSINSHPLYAQEPAPRAVSLLPSAVGTAHSSNEFGLLVRIRVDVHSHESAKLDGPHGLLNTLRVQVKEVQTLVIKDNFNFEEQYPQSPLNLALSLRRGDKSIVDRNIPLFDYHDDYRSRTREIVAKLPLTLGSIPDTLAIAVGTEALLTLPLTLPNLCVGAACQSGGASTQDGVCDSRARDFSGRDTCDPDCLFAGSSWDADCE